MSTWIIISWILVLVLTAINVAIFVKLKSASEQMMKMAFPNAKNMTEAVSQMQGMMGGMQGMGRPGSRGPAPYGAKPAGGKGAKAQEAQLKAAMEMLQNMQKGGKS